MNMQPVVQPKSSANGFGRRRSDREMGSKLDNKFQPGKSNSSRLINAGASISSKGGGYESPSCDRLLYLTTCLIGQHVEVQVKNGSTFSGIFHAANTEKGFGASFSPQSSQRSCAEIILKMARMTKDGSLSGQKSVGESFSKAPSKTLIIPAEELVQVVAKDVPVTSDGLSSEVQCERQQEIMLDSFISQSRHVELGRELSPWIPDEDDPQCPDLENIFDDPWNRRWDQFETNAALFGVKSTFDEELYTTKLERGPQTRELEREALRIAREIECEDTQDLHLAEERGVNFHENFDIDEETRFSSVYRGTGADDSGYDENEDIMFDSRSTETFGSSASVINRALPNLISQKISDGAGVSSSSLSVDEAQSSQSSTAADSYRDHVRNLATELPSKSYPAFDGENRVKVSLYSEQPGGTFDAKSKQMPAGDAQISKSHDSKSGLKKDEHDKGGLSLNAVENAPPGPPSKDSEMVIPSEPSKSSSSSKETPSVNLHGRPGSSTSTASDRPGVPSAPSVPALSPSSSLGSLSSEKSTLNPHAKEFKLNPNAKSFVPSQTPVRPPSPVADGSFYFPTTVPHMHGMPVGIGMGPSYVGQQPVIYNPHAAAQMQSPQGYFHPNGPQYGQQQMLVGQPRQVYMPNYPPEMPYKGRDY